ncbi:Rid family hydrolase [Rhodopseudomonas sp. B29]|uniref:Rid family hydrolase n=1 Tax=Rhodopseudomonas sp. B29 TaxID=95607 RepID=UPI0018FFEBAD|nr:Rid family hydrolase [Rhodopseudomonas sp. B29]
MTETLNRRSVMALAGATAGIAAIAPARAQEKDARRTDAMGKKALEIPADNPTFAASAGSYEKFGYSAAVRAGGLLFIAGQIGRRPDGKIGTTVAEQAELALQRTAEILRLEGLDMTDLVEVVSYHVDIQHNLEAFMAVKQRYTVKPYPAWSIIGVDALTSPDLKIEIRSIAALRS